MSNTDSKVFLIIGKSFAGKSTFLNKILSNIDFCKDTKLNRLVRYTTRKPRPDEADGENYYFINNEEFENRNYTSRDDVVVTSFESKFGTLHYVADFSKLESGKNYIVDGDPESIEPYKKILGNRLCVIYLIPPNWEIFRRFSTRDDNDEYTDLKYQEIYRRFLDDMTKFDLKSNTFINDCNCIICVGRNYSETRFDSFFSSFLRCDWNNMGVIIDKNSELVFNTSYGIRYCESYNDIFTDKKIVLYNSNIIIYPEEELYIFKRDSDSWIFYNKDRS